MPASVITAEHLSKRYLVGHRNRPDSYVTLRDRLTREMRNAARKTVALVHGQQIVQGDEVEEFWALKDVSFEVNEGEVFGIIGRNGAGKSTLLKILSRITEPTEGRVTLRGRVASLLEVGTGFHPELSGRENIYLNGAVLGMSRTEIRRKFDEIVAFAEIDRFLDTPVKRYSSGMYVRLAFAVAAHLEPEILIVDEVLAVGDAEFQRKCLGKMNEVSRRDGRTVLVVSHSMSVITGLCSKAVWLDHGSIHERGTPEAVVAQYLNRASRNQDRVVRLDHLQRDIWLDDRLRFESLEWISPLPLRHGQPARLRLRFVVRSAASDVSLAVGFSTVEGVRLVTYQMMQDAIRRDLDRPDAYSIDLLIDSLDLAPNLYNLDIGCRSGDFQNLDGLTACCQFEVVPGPTTSPAIAQGFSGVRLEGKWAWETSSQPSELDLASGERLLGGRRG